MVELAPLTLPYCKKVYEIAKESLPEHWSLKAIEDVLKYDNNIYYIAYEKTTVDDFIHVVGFAGIMVILEEAELLNIAVTPSARGKGIGNLLLTKMLEKAYENGAGRLLLEVRKSNVNAMNLYLKNGFAKLGERKNYYNNPVEDALILERLLEDRND